MWISYGSEFEGLRVYALSVKAQDRGLKKVCRYLDKGITIG